MKGIHRDERGIALLGAILGLILMGALVSFAFGPTVLEQRLAENARRSEHAFGVAEYGLSETIGSWDSDTWNSLGVADSATLSGTTADGRGSYSGTVQRMSNEIYLVTVTGNDPAMGARQRLGIFVKVSGFLDIPITAAARGGGGGGQAVVKGGVTVNGRDMIPPGWGPACSSPLEDKPGIEWQDDALVVVEPGGTLDGAPPLVEDPTINETNVFEWGSLDYDSLAAMAGIEIPGSNAAWGQINPQVTGGECDTVPWENWGAPEDPSSPCFDYFPIIHRPGPLTLTSGTGSGQGILLVDGELTIEGDFHFYGLVIVKGEIQMKGNVQITGAVIAGAQLQSEPGDVIQYSQCAVARALATGTGSGSAAPLRSRAWVYAF